MEKFSKTSLISGIIINAKIKIKVKLILFTKEFLNVNDITSTTKDTRSGNVFTF